MSDEIPGVPPQQQPQDEGLPVVEPSIGDSHIAAGEPVPPAGAVPPTTENIEVVAPPTPAAMSEPAPQDTASNRGQTAGAYCLRCRSPLPITGQGLHTSFSLCLRCGMEYNPSDPATFSTQKMPLRWKLWLPGLLLSILVGVLTYGIVRAMGTMGGTLFFVVPIATGLTLGLTTHPAMWARLFLVAAAVTVIVMIIVTRGWSGIFCGTTLALVFLIPTLVGAFIGWIIRRVMNPTFWERKRYYCLTFVALLPLVSEAAERQVYRTQTIVEVSTSATFQATPAAAWKAMVFYEQVKHEPPFLLKLSLPRPVSSEGDKSVVGARIRCTYQKGYLVKRITQVIPGRLLAFQVVEQRLHFEHDVKLLGGSFILEPVDDQHCRIVLTTDYERIIQPEWLWRPIEREVITTLHEFVLEGMRQRLVGNTPPVPASSA